ncbi:hypothetical protein ACFLRN_07875 [Thermoproteota archaeon]
MKRFIIFPVKKILSHRLILTAQRCVELYEEIYDIKPVEYVCEIATNVQEAKN